jgi:L-alanine-DL-glutamate epimerase-like enolase superfamily enzyme
VLPIESVDASVYRVPTDGPESDGTLEWSSTTMVVAEIRADGDSGLGWTYGASAAGTIIAEMLAPILREEDPFDIPHVAARMARAVRNAGRPGVAGCAIAALDTALWDLKAKLLGTSVVRLLGRVREAVPAYGSGGFCSYSLQRLADQLSAWAGDGLTMVKMKVGRDALADVRRVAVARQAIGADVQLFVDANGAYSRKQALAMASAFVDHGVTWFEEPVSSDDLEGLRLVRDRAPSGMEIAAGEYGWTVFDARDMIAANAVDVLQIDGTRCGGFSGYLRSAALCDAAPIPASAHTSPTLHAHIGVCTPATRHVEFFHDHARIEQRLLDGALTPVGGMLQPNVDRSGLGVEFKWADAKEFLEWSTK